MTLHSEIAPTSGGAVAPVAPDSRRSHIGGVVAGSLFAGLIAAVILPFLPASTVDADFSTAMVLFGFALGWALMAVLSIRFTDQPQRWAVVPAIFMALSAALVLLAPDAVVDALGWVWPPALLVLVIWVWIRAKRDLRSRDQGVATEPSLGHPGALRPRRGVRDDRRRGRPRCRHARSAHRRWAIPTAPSVHGLAAVRP